MFYWLTNLNKFLELVITNLFLIAMLLVIIVFIITTLYALYKFFKGEADD